MSLPLVYNSVSQPNPKPLYYKRIIWLGMSAKEPSLYDSLHSGSNISLLKEIVNESLYPVLLVWETNTGERKYKEISDQSRTDKVDRG